MSPPDSADPVVGRVIAGRYQIVRLLGEGGMGAVYEALQISMERPVAVKLIHPHIASRPEVAARFHREMKATSRVEHPNTIQVFDYGATEEGQLFLAMELLHGRSLARLLEQEGAMPVPRIIAIARQVVRALAAAHAEGIVHRDLKPDNIMLVDRYGDHDVVKVLDFGIARFVDGDEANANMTAEGALIGTPAYMSPEQALGRPLDARTDLYSLGVVMYQMAVGRPPFDATTLAGFLMAHVTETPAPISEVASGRVGANLERLILSLLAKAPPERPQSATEILPQLDACETETLPTPIPIAAPTERAAPLPPPSGTRWPWLVAAVVLGLGGIGAGFVLWRDGKRDRVRAQLDEILVRDGQPLPPPSCRSRDLHELVRLQQAATLLSGEQPAEHEALTILRAAEPRSAEAIALLARAEVGAEVDPAPALGSARRALAACPGFAVAFNVVGIAEQRAHHPDAAEVAYRRALDIEPGYPWPRMNLGLLALQRNDAAAALAAFDAVLAQVPDHLGARLGRAQARLDVGRYAEATQDLLLFTERKPTSNVGWLLLGQAYTKTGDIDHARRAFCRAAEQGEASAQKFCTPSVK